MPRELPLLSPFLLQPIALLSLVFVPLGILRRRWVPPLVVTLTIALLVGALTTIPLLGCVYGITLRYFADLTPALALLGSTALVMGYHWLSERHPAELQFGPKRSARSLLVSFAALSWACSLAIGVLLGWGAWTFAYPEQVVRPRRVSNELLAAVTARLRPDAVRDWVEPPEGTTWRMHDGSYLDEATIYLRSTQPESSLVLAVDWRGTAPTHVALRINNVDVDQHTLQPGRQLWVSQALPDLPVDNVVGVRLDVGLAGAQAGDVMPLTIYRAYFTRGEAEAAVYRTIASGVEQEPSASERLLATGDEVLVREALLATQAENARLRNELAQHDQPAGPSP
jgi:hypothetical protein